MEHAETPRSLGSDTPPDEPFAVCLAEVASALDLTAGRGSWTLNEDDLRARFDLALAIRARVDELTCRLLADVVDRELPRLDGASSPTAWLTGTRRLSGVEARRLLSGAAVAGSGASCVDGGGSTRLDPTRGAWVQGQVSTEQAVLIGETVAKVSRDVDDHRVGVLQSDLVGHAQVLTYRHLHIVCNRALETIDPETADALLAQQLENEEQRALQETRLRFFRKGPGLMGFTGAMPTAQYQMWKAALDGHSSPRHSSALEAAARLGPDDQGGRLSYEQRLGRALLELIEHLPTDKLARHGGTNVALVVSVTLDQLRESLGHALLGSDLAISPGQARRLACGAELIPAVLGTDSQVLDLGRSVRLFSVPQRTALEVRDRGCVFPGCERPAGWCESHHITGWARGGPTDIRNGCLMCFFHHHLIHSSAGWDVQMGRDHVPEILPPPSVDPSRRPRRHQRFAHPLRT